MPRRAANPVNGSSRHRNDHRINYALRDYVLQDKTTEVIYYIPTGRKFTLHESGAKRMTYDEAVVIQRSWGGEIIHKP